MKLLSLILGATAVLAAPAAVAPETSPNNVIEKRADMCGDWQTQTAGPYVLNTDQWGKAAATSGSQCSGIDKLSGNSLAWHTTWTWAGGKYNVKSYTNVVLNTASKRVRDIPSMKTTWKWRVWDYSYTGSNLVCNVAYDLFTSETPTGPNRYEVMIWLAALGGAGPISSTGSTPLATVSIGGVSWKLFKGPNGSMTVFSFVAQGNWQTNFSGDLKQHLQYLVDHQGLPSSHYIKNTGAGTEPFTGSNARLTTTGYSLVY